MKLIPRIRILCSLMLAVLLVPGLAVQAQKANCFGLGADDCALLQASVASSKPLSFNMAYELTLNASGPRGRSIDVSLKGSGPFEFDGDSLTTPGAVQLLTMQNTVASSVTTDSGTTTGNFEFRIVKGILYVEGEHLTDGQWRSIDLSQSVTGALRGRGLNDRALNPAALAELLQAGQRLATIPGFIRVERAADTTVENQQIASFVYHFDLPVLFNSTNFVTFLKTVFARTTALPGLNDPVIRALASRLALAFKDTTLTMTRLVGVTDKLPHGFGIDLVMKLDPRTLPPMLGSAALGTPDPSGQSISVNLHFLLTTSGIGSKAAVTAPEGATPFDPATLGGGQPASTPAAASQ